MLVYVYDSVTGVYAGEYVAQENPLEKGGFITPIASTVTAPPVAGANQVAVWANNAWALEPYFVGETWYDQGTGQAVVINTVGTPAANLAATPPPPTAAQLLASYRDSAKLALSVSDDTMHRIAEAVSLGLTTWTAGDVVAWVEYRRALRADVSAATVGTLPVKPAYPAGT